VLKLDDRYDHCVQGVVVRCGSEPFVVYDPEKVIGVLMEEDGMEHMEAVEFFEFNILGSWVGEDTPGYLQECTMEEIDDGWG